MNAYAVFTHPDPEQAPVFWGAFLDRASADVAITDFLEGHLYWDIDEFEIKEFPLGVLL
jgi:hypothetical protein